jgi:hypothetical protein
MYIEHFFLLCFPFNIFPMNNKIKLDIQWVFWKVEIKNYQNLVQFSFSPAFRQQISSMIYTKNGGKWRFSMNKNRIHRPKISDFRQLSDRNSSYYGIFSIYYFLHVSSDRKNICTSTLFSYYAFLSIYFQ